MTRSFQQAARSAAAALLLLVPGLRGQEAAPARAYVANQGEATVSVLDLASLEVVETVDLQALGFSENAKPHHVVVEPDGSYWYLSLIGENRVLKFDRDNRLVGQAEFEVPGMLALHPDGERLYVGRSMSAVNPPQRIGVIQRHDMSVDEIDIFFARPHALTVHPSGRWIYSASLAANQLGAVDAESWQMELTSVEGPVHALVQFAVAPDGTTLVATSELTGRLLVFDLGDPARPALTASIEVGQRPWHPVFDSDGRYVYFGNKGSNTISVVDVEKGQVVRTIEGDGLDQPHGSALSPDGRYLLVSNNGPGGMGMDMGGDHAAHHPEGGAPGGGYNTGTVVVVDTASGEIVRVIPVGRNATGIGAPSGR